MKWYDVCMYIVYSMQPATNDDLVGGWLFETTNMEI
jgi:hypothetical protein